MVLRDQPAEFINKVRYIRSDSEIIIYEAETKGILEALTWIHDIGIL